MGIPAHSVGNDPFTAGERVSPELEDAHETRFCLPDAADVR
jgi:hypothetical protein